MIRVADCERHDNEAGLRSSENSRKGANSLPAQITVPDKTGPEVLQGGLQALRGGMGTLGTSDIFLFEHLRLDRRGLFRREEDGGLVPLKIGSRAEEILRVLVERAGELVSKEEIISRVWPETIVEESNLTVQISTLRRFLGELSAEGGYIQTVPGRGYSLCREGGSS